MCPFLNLCISIHYIIRLLAHLIHNTLVRRILKTVFWVIIVVVLLPLALYVPAVQDIVVPFALRKVSESGDMTIEADRFRLRWPLRIELEGVRVLTAPSDTMVALGRANLEVMALPLLKLDVRAYGQLNDVMYQMGTPDSAMYIKAYVNDFKLSPSSYGLSDGHIKVSDATVDGADINLIMKGESSSEPDTATSSTQMLIEADRLQLLNVRYRMSMYPTIDSLGAFVPSALLADGVVDIGRSMIDARLLQIDSVDVAYIFPPADSVAKDTVVAKTAVDTAAVSAPWQIRAREISMTGRKATYAMSGAVPQPGLDMNYIEAQGIELRVDSFYNCGTAIKVPLTNFRATERCGVVLSANGVFEMDSIAMYARDFVFETLFSDIKLNATMGMGDLSRPEQVPLSAEIEARIGAHDVDQLMPSLAPLMKQLPTYNDIRFEASAEGTMASLNIHKLKASLPGCVELSAAGAVSSFTDPDNLGGRLSLHGAIQQPASLKPLLAQLSPNMPVSVPRMRVDGSVVMNRGNIAGNLKALTEEGQLGLDATWNGRLIDYTVGLHANAFPLNAFLPQTGLKRVWADINVDGRGFDPDKLSTRLKADATLHEVEYLNHALKDIRLWAKLDSGNVDAGVVSLNNYADFDITVGGQLAADRYSFDIDGDVRNLDLRQLGMSDTTNRGSVSLGGTVEMTPARQLYDVNLKVTALAWEVGDVDLSTPEIGLNFVSTDTTVHAGLDNETLRVRFNSACGLDSLLAAVDRVTISLDSAIERRSLHIEKIQHALPGMEFTVNSGSESVINGFLATSKIRYKGYNFRLANDSTIHANGKVERIKSPSFAIDTIALDMYQSVDSLLGSIQMHNRPGTMDDFAHVVVSGKLSPMGLSLMVDQQDINNRVGYDIGAFIGMADSVAYMHLTPQHPVIAYKEWTINGDNFISYDIKHSHFDADLEASCGESYLMLKTDHNHEHIGVAAEAEDITLKASNIELSDWLSISPFAPPIKGLLGAEINVFWDPEKKSLTGDGSAQLENLFYNNERVGSFDLGFGLSTNNEGVIHASTSLLVDSVKVITAVGALNDSTKPSPMTLDFSMIHFPLSIVNPFMPEGMVHLRGMLNGTMDITGTLAHPQFNGFVQFDSAAVKVDMLGTDFRFPDTKIPMDSNVVVFNNYAIHALNENPLLINGEVNLKSLSTPAIRLNMKANNMQILGSEKKRGQDAYGKAFINASADVRGNMNLMIVDADLTLRSGSNLTYVMSTSASEITQNTDQSSVVRFVEFADTASLADADSINNAGMALLLNAVLNIKEGTTINVELPGSGQDKVQLLGNGSLTFSMSPFGSMRLTGRYNLDGGFVRYSPPLISQKTFRFQSGSYVAFNGDMMNPLLNIHATDQVKANVTEEGQDSRLVNFNVGLSVTNTLANMDVKFDLSTNDDLSVQNELQTMSPEQRANQAMNMLLYNVYTGPGTKGTSASNPLFSFLASQLNTWAANSIKGVDIQFGVDQYDHTVQGSTSTAMTYSYKVSKSLFNDRFKINVGGNYTTDAGDSENLEQNLINDVSVEYLLNRSGSMYVKLFRHVGYESILEGEVTQTGVGFVYKRKLNSLTEMFLPWQHRKRRKAAREAAAAEAALKEAEQKAASSNENVNTQTKSNEIEQ